MTNREMIAKIRAYPGSIFMTNKCNLKNLRFSVVIDKNKFVENFENYFSSDPELIHKWFRADSPAVLNFDDSGSEAWLWGDESV